MQYHVEFTAEQFELLSALPGDAVQLCGRQAAAPAQR